MDKPRLSFWQIWNMSFGFLGIQFGWGLQMANMSVIYKYLGASEGDIPILWLAAPLTGLIVQPIIGHYSDRTWNRLGRRRPYFVVGAVLSSLALIAMPNSSALWMAAGLLWVLDASVNVSMEPFRAFVGDILPHEQRKSGFAMQSLLIGAGAVLSSLLPYALTNWFGVSGESTAESAIPPAIHFAFTIGALVFFLAVMVTVLTTKEYPPEDLEAFEKMKRESAGFGNALREIFGGIKSMPKAMRKLAWVQFFSWFALFCMWIYFAPGIAKAVFEGETLGVQDAQLDARLDEASSSVWLDTAAAAARGYGALKEEIAASQSGHQDGDSWLSALGLAGPPPDPASKIGPSELERVLGNAVGATQHAATASERDNPMVRTIASLLMTSGVEPGQPATGGSLSRAATALADRLAVARRYQDGAAWGGVCFAMYNLVAFIFAFALLGLVERFSARSIHIGCLAAGGLGLLSALVVDDPNMLLASMVGVGIAWASILAMPYAMLSNALPPEKMGFYMGVFNFFIVAPQILASVGLGWVMEHFLAGDAMKAILLGGFSMILASLLTLRVRVEDTE